MRGGKACNACANRGKDVCNYCGDGYSMYKLDNSIGRPKFLPKCKQDESIEKPKILDSGEQDESIEKPKILDSGERTEFSSGAVRDMHAGKGRMDLLPWAAIMEIAKHCENGAIKYGEHNVDKGIPTHSLCDSAARHLAKYLDGWDDEPHLVAAAWNLLFAIQMEIKYPELVDTPWMPTEN